MAVIPALRRQKQENGTFKASLSYIPCFNKTKTKMTGFHVNKTAKELSLWLMHLDIAFFILKLISYST
jgi:hypothetical protein